MRVIRFAHTSVGAVMPVGRLYAHQRLDRERAWGDGSGRGVGVCVIDSGVDPAHPLVGELAGSFGTVGGDDGRWRVERDDSGDASGHGTACAGIVRAMAPDCEITSVRVIGTNKRGSSPALIAAIRWAVEQRFAVVSISLSTQQHAAKEDLHDLADQAYFEGVTLVSAAHNNPIMSYPWRFSSVISVGSHDYDDRERIEANPAPPVEFFGAGVQIPVAWPGGGTRVLSGNSFATPHIAGMCARILGEHPEFRTTQLRHVLTSIADNIGGDEP